VAHIVLSAYSKRVTGYENGASSHSDIEQRGVRFPADWRPDAVSEHVARQQCAPGSSAISTSDSEPSVRYSMVPSQKTQQQPTIQLVLEYQFKYSMAAICVQLICMAIGGWLAYSGAVGKTSFTARLLSDIGLKVQMTNAGPGTVLFVVALLMITITRFHVRIDK
jgi:hypothetical protein